MQCMLHTMELRDIPYIVNIEKRKEQVSINILNQYPMLRNVKTLRKEH